MRQKYRRAFSIVCVLQAMLAACASLPAPMPVPVPSSASVLVPDTAASQPDIAVPALIAAERAATIDGDMPTLVGLWAADARIVDGRGTVDLADDYVWQGHDAVMDRYELAVLPAPPPPLASEQLEEITITADDGIAYAEMGIDRWILSWQDGRWWLLELRYN